MLHQDYINSIINKSQRDSINNITPPFKIDPNTGKQFSNGGFPTFSAYPQQPTMSEISNFGGSPGPQYFGMGGSYDEIMKLHGMHMDYPKTATKKSQTRLIKLLKKHELEMNPEREGKLKRGGAPCFGCGGTKYGAGGTNDESISELSKSRGDNFLALLDEGSELAQYNNMINPPTEDTTYQDMGNEGIGQDMGQNMAIAQGRNGGWIPRANFGYTNQPGFSQQSKDMLDMYGQNMADINQKANIRNPFTKLFARGYDKKMGDYLNTQARFGYSLPKAQDSKTMIPQGPVVKDAAFYKKYWDDQNTPRTPLTNEQWAQWDKWSKGDFSGSTNQRHQGNYNQGFFNPVSGGWSNWYPSTSQPYIRKQNIYIGGKQQGVGNPFSGWTGNRNQFRDMTPVQRLAAMQKTNPYLTSYKTTKRRIGRGIKSEEATFAYPWQTGSPTTASNTVTPNAAAVNAGTPNTGTTASTNTNPLLNRATTADEANQWLTDMQQNAGQSGWKNTGVPEAPVVVPKEDELLNPGITVEAWDNMSPDQQETWKHGFPGKGDPGPFDTPVVSEAPNTYNPSTDAGYDATAIRTQAAENARIAANTRNPDGYTTIDGNAPISQEGEVDPENFEYDTARNAHLKANPGDIEGAQAAGTAAYNATQAKLYDAEGNFIGQPVENMLTGDPATENLQRFTGQPVQEDYFGKPEYPFGQPPLPPGEKEVKMAEFMQNPYARPISAADKHWRENPELYKASPPTSPKEIKYMEKEEKRLGLTPGTLTGKTSRSFSWKPHEPQGTPDADAQYYDESETSYDPYSEGNYAHGGSYGKRRRPLPKYKKGQVIYLEGGEIERILAAGGKVEYV